METQKHDIQSGSGAVAEGRDNSKARPTHSEDGVDLTLIRWMLSLTPTERLRVLTQNIRAMEKLRDAAKRQ